MSYEPRVKKRRLIDIFDRETKPWMKQVTYYFSGKVKRTYFPYELLLNFTIRTMPEVIVTMCPSPNAKMARCCLNFDWAGIATQLCETTHENGNCRTLKEECKATEIYFILLDTKFSFCSFHIRIELTSTQKIISGRKLDVLSSICHPRRLKHFKHNLVQS